jgi:hypothetical protein
MSSHSVPLNELTVAVQNAVKQALGKHGAVPIDQLWVGFVAPETVATEEAAAKVAAELGKGASGRVQASVQVLESTGTAGASPKLVVPHRIIGLIYDPY